MFQCLPAWPVVHATFKSAFREQKCLCRIYAGDEQDSPYHGRGRDLVHKRLRHDPHVLSVTFKYAHWKVRFKALHFYHKYLLLESDDLIIVLSGMFTTTTPTLTTRTARLCRGSGSTSLARLESTSTTLDTAQVHTRTHEHTHMHLECYFC